MIFSPSNGKIKFIFFQDNIPRKHNIELFFLLNLLNEFSERKLIFFSLLDISSGNYVRENM